MNELEALNIIKRVKVTWSNYQIEDAEMLLSVYMDWLGGFPAEDVQAAIKTFKGSRFAPGPAEILGVLQPDPEFLGEPWMARPYGGASFFSPETTDTPEVA